MNSAAKLIPGAVLGLLSMLLFAIMGMCSKPSSSHKRTDGVFESATAKMDNGEALNDREAQRLNDIINWEESKKKYNIK